MKPGIQNGWKELHAFLAKNNIRFFDVCIDNEKTTLAHPNKSVEGWREDMRGALKIVAQKYENREKGNISLDLVHTLIDKFGYIEMLNLVDDVYEGSIRMKGATIVDDPLHENQEDGFGHYGWNKLDTSH